MNDLATTYRTSLSLFTDLYQLTMAHGYWQQGCADRHAVFHLFFRKSPFDGGYAVCAGLSHVIALLETAQFEESDLSYLRTLRGNDGDALFDPAFLDYLAALEFKCDVDAIPEGNVVFAREPLIRVSGPILQCQLLESAMLNMVNFQTLVATKSARICQAAGDDPVLEFGLRRAQGIDGALTASRAAYIGGCAATSNVLAGKMFGIPVKGTHAHSWVMSFDTELASFEAYADAMPNNCVFLVDTFDTLSGVRNAILMGKALRDKGHNMVGIRLDFGDLAYLSIEARRLLDEAGFQDAVIVASNDLDEHVIADLKSQGAQIAVWGVGTKLATSFDQPALGGVYKLGATRDENNNWQHKIKVSEQSVKTTIPGMLQVRRFEQDGSLVADIIYDELLGDSVEAVVIDPADSTRSYPLSPNAVGKDLLIPIARQGKIVYEEETLDVIRDRAKADLAKLHPGIRRFMNPHEYPVGLEPRLAAKRSELIQAGVTT